jgi:threonine dehydratase
MKESKLVVEFSGAATVAAVLAGRAAGSRVAAILSGGNLDAARALELIASRAASAAA